MYITHVYISWDLEKRDASVEEFNENKSMFFFYRLPPFTVIGRLILKIQHWKFRKSKKKTGKSNWNSNHLQLANKKMVPSSYKDIKITAVPLVETTPNKKQQVSLDAQRY